VGFILADDKSLPSPHAVATVGAKQKVAPSGRVMMCASVSGVAAERIYVDKWLSRP
jgi:hypothetical protein